MTDRIWGSESSVGCGFLGFGFGPLVSDLGSRGLCLELRGLRRSRRPPSNGYPKGLL